MGRVAELPGRTWEREARMSELTSRLRGRIGSREPLLVPGAANALTARVIEDLGYEAIYVTGAGVSNTYLGVPDVGIVGLTDLAGHVSAIRDSTELPLVVDADTGFGNAVNVARTVKVLERSGANAIQLEDQVFPKRCGHFEGKDVIPATEMVQKIHAALDARSHALLIARTDARSVLGLEAALERAQAYYEAGADVIFVEAPQSRSELASVTQRVQAPHVANMVVGGKTPLISLEEAGRLGFAIVLYANVALQAAVKAMQVVLGQLRQDGCLGDAETQVASFGDRQRLVQKAYFDELETRYASSETP